MNKGSVAQLICMLLGLLLMMGDIVMVMSRNLKPIVAHYKKSKMTVGGQAVCALDEGNKTTSSSSLHDCLGSCTRDETCKSFNIMNWHTCDLYNFEPRVFAPIPDCINYKKRVEDEIDCLEYGNSATSIPPKCCAIPYILDGAVYYNCSVNSAISSEFGCYRDNVQWAACLQPTEFVAQYEETFTTHLTADPAVSVPLLTINGWILMQRKVTGGSMSFNQNWVAYRDGFGSAAGNDNYWLGLEKVHRLMQLTTLTLRVEIQRTTGVWYWAEYSMFYISNEDGKYQLTVGGYFGIAGDALAGAAHPNYMANGRKFTTSDSDNDLNGGGNCAVDVSGLPGGWWYGQCSRSVLNLFGPGLWTTTTEGTGNVQTSRMLLKLVY